MKALGRVEEIFIPDNVEDRNRIGFKISLYETPRIFYILQPINEKTIKIRKHDEIVLTRYINFYRTEKSFLIVDSDIYEIDPYDENSKKELEKELETDIEWTEL